MMLLVEGRMGKGFPLLKWRYWVVALERKWTSLELRESKLAEEESERGGLRLWEEVVERHLEVARVECRCREGVEASLDVAVGRR